MEGNKSLYVAASNELESQIRHLVGITLQRKKCNATKNKQEITRLELIL